MSKKKKRTVNNMNENEKVENVTEEPAEAVQPEAEQPEAAAGQEPAEAPEETERPGETEEPTPSEPPEPIETPEPVAAKADCTWEENNRLFPVGLWTKWLIIWSDFIQIYDLR